MKFRLLTIVAAIIGIFVPARTMNYAGADISQLPLYELIGAEYRDYDGNQLEGNDVIKWYAAQGMNTMRVRLFVDPSKSMQSAYYEDKNACQTKEYILPICQRIKQAGMRLILDFHYSDIWADPNKQWTPQDWRDLSDDQLYQKIYDYTKETLQWFKDRGVVPDMIQTGNEISWGMLWGNDSNNFKKANNWDWDYNWERFSNLLKRAGEACREVCPLAKIIIHTEQVTNEPNLWNLYRHINDAGVKYDIIGLSWYPYWHGDVTVLDYVLGKIEENFPDKKIMLVEFNHPYSWEEASSNGIYNTYPATYDGQQACTQATIDVVNRHPNCNGVIWWWAEFNKYNRKNDAAEFWTGWYSSPLFDSWNGQATPATRLLADYAKADPGYNVYFVNLPASWSSAGLYAFNNDYNGGQIFDEAAWPGRALEPTDKTYKGKQVWKYTLSGDQYKRLIVNNRHDDGSGNYTSTDQTIDFDFEDGAIYWLSDWRIDDGGTWKYELWKQDAGATFDAPYVYLATPDSWSNPVVSAWTNDGDNECDGESLEDTGMTYQGRKVWKKTFSGDKHNTLLFYDYPWENDRIAENRQFVNGALYIISDNKNCQWDTRYTAAYILDPSFDGSSWMPDNIDLYGNFNGIEDWSDSAVAYRARRTGSERYTFDLEVYKESWFRLRIGGEPYGPEWPDADRDLATGDNEVRVRYNRDKAFHIAEPGSYTITVEWRGDDNQYMLSIGQRREPVVYPDLYIIGDQYGKEWKASADWRLNPDNGQYTITLGDCYPESWFKVSTADWTETYSTGKAVWGNHTYLCNEDYNPEHNMHVDQPICGANGDGSTAIAIFDWINNTFRIEAWTADKFDDRDHKRIYIHFGHNRQLFGSDATPRVHLFDRNRITPPSDDELLWSNSFDLTRADSSDPTYDLWYYELTDDQMNWAEDATFFYENKDASQGRFAKYTCGLSYNGQDFNWDFRNWHKYIYYVDVADNYNGKATQSYITWDQLRPLRAADKTNLYVVGCGFTAIDKGSEGRDGWDRIVDRSIFSADATMNVFYVENMQKGQTVLSTTLDGNDFYGAKFKMSWIYPWYWWDRCRSAGDIYDQRAWATFNLGIIGYDLTRAGNAGLNPDLAQNKTNYEVYFESAKTFPCNNFNQYDWFVPESLLNGTYTLVVDLDADCNSATLLPFAPNPTARTNKVEIVPALLDSYADIDRLWSDASHTFKAAGANGPVKFRKYNVATADLGVDSPTNHSAITRAGYNVDYALYYNGEKRATYSGVPGSVSVAGIPVGENDYVGIRAKYTDTRTRFTFHSKYSQDKVSVTAQTPAPQIGNASSLQFANRTEYDGWFTLGAYFSVPVNTPTNLNWYADYEVTPEGYTDDNIINKGGDLMHTAHPINSNGRFGSLNGWSYYGGGTFGDTNDWSDMLSDGREWPIYLDVVKSLERKDNYTAEDGRASLWMDAYAVYPFLVDLNPVPTAGGSRSAAPRKAHGITDGHSYKLTFVRTQAGRQISLNDVITGIDNVGADGAAGPVTYYNLQGVEVNGDLAPGIYIRRQGNTATKIMVR